MLRFFRATRLIYVTTVIFLVCCTPAIVRHGRNLPGLSGSYSRIVKNSHDLSLAMQSIALSYGDTRAVSVSYDTLIDLARSAWIRALTTPDSQGQASIQTVWPDNQIITTISITTASWILALHRQGYGVLGTNGLSYDLVLRIKNSRGIVFVEHDEAFIWADTIIQRGARAVLGFSNNSSLELSKHGQTYKIPRQCVIVLPDTVDLCAFMAAFKNDKQIELFWYPSFLYQYRQRVGKSAVPDSILNLPAFLPCTR